MSARERMYGARERACVSWAAPTLTRLGCTLYSTVDGWDIELPAGSWRTAANGFELSQLAHELGELTTWRGAK